jgi:membrane-bound serine protease (ClpP class)
MRVDTSNLMWYIRIAIFYERFTAVRRVPLLLPILVFLAAPLAADDVFLVKVSGTIEKGLAAFIDRVMSEAESEDVQAVIIEIDTPGGALDAALVIRDALLYSEVKTIAFINPRAISAGALISLATDHIVMVEGGTIGAATAVDMQGNKASEKVISYFRNEMKATAEKTGRSSELAEAMVDEDVDVEALAPKGKLLTLTTEEAFEQKLAEHKIASINEKDKLAELLKLFELEDSNVVRKEINWAEQAVRWLTYPMVASLLMTLGFLGLIFEFQSPGWGVGGTLALVCLGLFFGSHLIVKLASLSEVLLFAIGLMLVIADLFFVTGFGLLALPGFVLIFTSLFLSLMGPLDLWTWDSAGTAVRPIIAAMLLTLVIGGLMLRRLPKSTTWQRVVLDEQESGYQAAPIEHRSLEGKAGKALTDLRPGGTAEVDGHRVSVTTEGDFLEKNTEVKVVEVEGNRIVVRMVDPA